MRVPVVSVDGEALMSTTPCRARKMVRDGVTEKRWNKLGQFYIKMTRKVGVGKQRTGLAVDYGSKWDGYAVGTEREVNVKGMAKLPERVSEKMDGRARLRRCRRSRKWRRPCRFDNRRRKQGWLTPTQKAKVELREKIVRELAKIYPIFEITVEDVAYNHYKHSDGKYFSTAEIGKSRFYQFLRKIAPLITFKGWQTAQFREKYEIPKSEEKDAVKPESHANDAVAMLCGLFGCLPEYEDAPFWYWQRPEFYRRALHRQHHQKGGIRPRFGGTTNGEWLRKGDYVEVEKSGEVFRGWVCGLPTDKTNLVGVCDIFARRIGQFSPNETKLIRRSTGALWRQMS